MNIISDSDKKDKSKIFLINCIPGISKQDIIPKIYCCSGQLGIKNIKIFHLHNEIKDILKAEQAEPEFNGLPFEEDPLLVAMSKYSPPKISKIWTQVYSKDCQEIINDGLIGIIISTFICYRSQTYEFFSPVNIDTIKEYRPSAILTLIDDIYDIYYRLSKDREVFAIKRIMNHDTNVSKLLKCISIKIENGECYEDESLEVYKKSLQLVMGNLLQILSWREKEILTASLIAQYLSIKHYVLAIKHPIETCIRLLLGEYCKDFNLCENYPVYISHPITGPRKKQIKEGNWPKEVSELANVVKELRGEEINRQVLTIIPTTIDEYRLVIPKKKEEYNKELYLEKSFPHTLHNRWPINYDNSLWSLPKKRDGKEFLNYNNYEKEGLSLIFNPLVDCKIQEELLQKKNEDNSFKNVKDIINCVKDKIDDKFIGEIVGMLMSLQENIRIQMAGRDHRLVRQCPGLFLYRPMNTEDHGFSGGVISEIDLFGDLMLTEEDRKMSFIHDEKDIQNIFNENFGLVIAQIIGYIQTEIIKWIKASGTKQLTVSLKDEDQAILLGILKTFGDIPVDICEKLLIKIVHFKNSSTIDTGEREPSLKIYAKKLRELIHGERLTIITSSVAKSSGDINCVYLFDKKRMEYSIYNKPGNKILVILVKDLEKNDLLRYKSVNMANAFFQSK